MKHRRDGILACEVCGSPATYEGVFAPLAPLPEGHPQAPQNGWNGVVQLCAPCVAEGVPPGWTIRELQKEQLG